MSADSFEEEAKYAEIYMEFSDLIGESNMRKVYNRYRGLKVDFPKTDLFKRICRANAS